MNKFKRCNATLFHNVSLLKPEPERDPKPDRTPNPNPNPDHTPTLT